MGILRNPRRERFAKEFVAGKSLGAAYKSAGYRGDRRNALRLRRLPDVSQRIDQLLAARAEDELAVRELAKKDAAMSLGELLAELKAIGLATIGDIVDWNREGGVTVKPKSELTRAQISSIQEIRQIEFFGPKGEMVSRRLSIKLYDKLSALEKCARNLGAYEPRDRISMAQVDDLLRAVLKLLERHFGRDRLAGAVAELRELSQALPGQQGLNGGTTH